MTTFRDFLHQRLESGGFTTEDALASFLPLLRQVVAAHNSGKVAPLEGVEAVGVDGIQLRFNETKLLSPRVEARKLHDLEKGQRHTFAVVGESRITLEVANGGETVVDLQISCRGDDITRPVYLPGYISWEHEIGHHDPLTDTFSLGLILASLTCGLDLNHPEDLARFVSSRGNLFSLNDTLHPVLAKAVVRMTELDRHQRPQDLSALLQSLDNYRDQDIDFEFELARNQEFRTSDTGGKRRVILTALQQRLFEISRRNRLLHFRATMHTVNLTWASVPLSFDVSSIRPEQILTWNSELETHIGNGKPIPLNKYLRFEEAVYLPSLLDRIRQEAQRDQVEFGFAQLRLVLSFLRWSNFKEKPPERFDSPLVLLPARVVKKKGVRDTFALELLSSEAEVNPVLRQYFKQLYDVNLPETVELATAALDTFYDLFSARLQASEPALRVTKIDRPRIRLIHAKAQRRLDQYRQQTRLSGRGIRTFRDLDYSYDRDNFHPLGLRLFQLKIRRPETNLQAIVQESVRPRTFMLPDESSTEAVAEKERQFYSVAEPEETNPYNWELDLCSLTLGNFRYRKMSLVRDYAALLDNGTNNPAFEAVFSSDPRPVADGPHAPPPLEDQYPVLPCDPTQTSAIVCARTGRSYIIQGPPGTGKSQTIANLIADHVAHDRRVLFVCEKRAAIDVVYHRLRQHGLHPLCSLIHDSQADKKEFIMDLKATYELFLEPTGKNEPPAEKHRQEILRAIERELRPLQQFHDTMSAAPEGGTVSLQHLLQRLVELRGSLPELTAVEKERIPPYSQWCANRERLERLTATLQDICGDGMLARNPLKHLSTRLTTHQRPLETMLNGLERATRLVEELERESASIGLLPSECDTPEKALQAVKYAAQVHSVAEKGLLSLLEPASPQAKEFANTLKTYRKRIKTLEKARGGTANWKEKLPPSDVKTAYEQAKLFERTSFNFFKPSWWRLRRILIRVYDFRAHRVKPSWTRILGALGREYEALEAVEEVQTRARTDFAFDGPLEDFAQRRDDLIGSLEKSPVATRDLHRRLLGAAGDAVVVGLARLQEKVEQLDGALASFLDGYGDRTFADLKDQFAQISEGQDEIADLLPCLTELAALLEGLRETLRSLPLGLPQLEAAMARRTWDDVCRSNRAFNRFTAQTRSRHVGQLDKAYSQFCAANAAVVCDRVRQRFLEHVRASGLSHAQLSPEEKEFKTIYNRGRRELEHEFGKTIRYRSIRDLVSGDPGIVIRDLKPVWLMSPLSVSDTLPLDTAHFDIVIFDEASQVTLEEAVPSMFRANHVIVVGDQMQLPPTNFFSAKHDDDEEHLRVEDEDTGEIVEYDLASNSFLAQAARVLPSTMLGWHYRSRSESLISFSNAAFYQGQLLTVPEQTLPGESWNEIRVSIPEEADDTAALLLERPVSFHFIEHGIYRNRRNPDEADYIAQLVRAILARETGLSIGIVAFSEAQQDEIQDALNRLADEDNGFRQGLEAEFEREEDGQFLGLLVKNLENIQGDERDIVVLSVCYGPGPNGRMLMSFGPINQSGGEKRLNVAFSRAKRHMAVVSSIRHQAITNDYNDGARCLRNYLRYAEAVSIGDRGTAKRTLREVSAQPDDGELGAESSRDAVIEELAAALRDQGYRTDLAVGQSSFRCALAIRRDGDRAYRAGILVDTDAYYQQTDILERDVQRPKLLESFGWKIVHVLAKDWYEDRSAVLKTLEQFFSTNDAD
jgi:hypothetical protein